MIHLTRHRNLYHSPEDDCITPLLELANSANLMIRAEIYSVNLPELIDVFIAKHQAGVDVKLILDKTQAAGPSERPLVAKLQAAGVPLVIGTSPRKHIVHDKNLYVKYTDPDGCTQERIGKGSFNWGRTAQEEANTFEVEDTPEVVAFLLSSWQYNWDWICKNVPQPV